MKIPPPTAGQAVRPPVRRYRSPAPGEFRLSGVLVPQGGDQACINLLIDCVSHCSSEDPNCHCYCAQLASACGGWPSAPCHYSE